MAKAVHEVRHHCICALEVLDLAIERGFAVRLRGPGCFLKFGSAFRHVQRVRVLRPLLLMQDEPETRRQAAIAA